MTDRDRFLACLNGESLDRSPYWLFWTPWPTTRARWVREGMPEGCDPRELFGSDKPSVQRVIAQLERVRCVGSRDMGALRHPDFLGDRIRQRIRQLEVGVVP